jgi:hypothetical protein
MPEMKYGILKHQDRLEFVEMPASHMYQLTALNRRLHKELEKLTANSIPALPHVIAECTQLELVSGSEYAIVSGLDYLNELERSFASVNEKMYPLISLLTEIRALQAQLEQWYEEEYEA